MFEGHHGESVYYRPVLMAAFILEYQLWDLNPLWYHLVNIMFHIATALVLYLLVEKLTQSAPVALTSALLFGLHPIQVESVAWIAGLNDVILGFFVCLMIYWYAESRERADHPSRPLALSVLFFALALFTKEAAAFYLLLLPLYDLCLSERPGNGFIAPGSLRRYASFAGVLALYLAVRHAIFGEFVGAERLYGNKPLLQRLQDVPGIVSEYLLLIAAPFRLSVAHPINQLKWFQPPWTWAAAGVVIAFTLLVWWSWRRDRIAAFGLLWFVVGLLPTLDIVPVAVPILEHRMYLPLAGLALAVSRAIYAALGRRPDRPAGKLAPAIALLLLATVSYARLPVWRNSENLWLDAIEKAPGYSRSYFNLAGYYFNLQRYDDAIRLLNAYVRIRPDEYLGYSKLRETYYLAGRYDDALRVCREMIARSPRDANRYIETSELFETMRMPDSAIATCRAGLQADSSLFRLHEHLGAIFAGMDSMNQAEREYRWTLSLNPQYMPAWYALGQIQALRRELLPAIRSIEEGLQYGTPSPDVLRLLSNLYAETGQDDKARALRARYTF